MRHLANHSCAEVSLAGSIIAVSFVVARQQLWLEAIEKRVSVTSQMLGAMKGVKMCGLTDVLRTRIQSMRDNELRISGKFRRLLIWNMGLGKLPHRNNESVQCTDQDYSVFCSDPRPYLHICGLHLACTESGRWQYARHKPSFYISFPIRPAPRAIDFFRHVSFFIHGFNRLLLSYSSLS